MKHIEAQLSEFLAEVVMTSHYLAEPLRASNIDLHDAEMKCLKIIATLGPMTMHEVALAMHATKPRATQLIIALESGGLVERTVGTDHRVRIARVTPQGHAVIAEARKKYDELAKSIYTSLGESKTAQLCDLLADITPLSQFTASQRNVRQGE